LFRYLRKDGKKNEKIIISGFTAPLAGCLRYGSAAA
jgi:hypothetical protein